MKNLIAAIGLTLASTIALATPTLDQVVPYATAPLQDTGYETFQIIDTDGVTDTVTAFTINRNAGFTNTFGFYDLTDSANRLSIFDGVSSNLSAETILWNGTGYGVLGGAAAVFGSGSEFGLYSVNNGGNTWFSESLRNADGLDHWLTFQTLGSTPGLLGVMNWTFALDDQFGGGDQDFDDLVSACIDCVAAGGGGITRIPEPTPLALMGFGLLFMRKRLNGSLL